MSPVRLFLKKMDFPNLAIILLEIHQYKRKNTAVRIFLGKYAFLFGVKSTQSWKGTWKVYHLAKKFQNLPLEMLHEEKYLNLESCEITESSQYYWVLLTLWYIPTSASGCQWLSSILRAYTLMELLLAAERTSQKHVRMLIQVPSLTMKNILSSCLILGSPRKRSSSKNLSADNLFEKWSKEHKRENRPSVIEKRATESELMNGLQLWTMRAQSCRGSSDYK